MTDTQEPVAWRSRIKGGVLPWAVSHSKPSRYEGPDEYEIEPLFTADQLDAAVRAAVERCVLIARTCDGPYCAPTDEEDRAIADMAERIAAAIEAEELP